MIHRLTLGHLDPIAIIRDRMVAVQGPLDMGIVHRLLAELGKVDTEGRWTLDDDAVTFTTAILSSPGREAGAIGSPRNLPYACTATPTACWPTESMPGSSRRSSSKACVRIPPVSRVSITYEALHY